VSRNPELYRAHRILADFLFRLMQLSAASGNISVIKISSSLSLSLSLSLPLSFSRSPATCAAADSREQTILVCLANKGFLAKVGETSRGGRWMREVAGMKMRGCRKEATGGESREQNYYIFCPKARIAPFAELRDRDSTA